MKLIKQLFYILIPITLLSSCDNYLDVNTSPNNPQASQVTPSLVLPAAQNGSFSALVGSPNNLGNVMMNQWAGDVTNFTSGNTDEYFYNITSSFYSNVWDSFYLATDKLQAIINADSDENRYFAAIAKIMKVRSMQNVVDLYGDAPYSEAFQRGLNYQPSYDNDSDIYMALYDDLDSAIDMINNAPLNAENPGTSDVILGGDMDTWVKVANTLKLKLLVRASSSSNGDVQTFVNSKFPSLASATFLGAGENVTINPGYVADVGKQNPFWNRYGFSSDGNQTQTNKFTVGSEHFIEFLKGNGPAPFDNRISAFFTTASGSGGDYQGVEQGADDPDDPSIGLSFIGSGLLNSASQSGYYFTASESLFLQAEAALNGRISGTASQFFDSAITESFNMYGVGGAASYISSITGLDGVGWASSNLEAIMLQKWIAMHSLGGAESLIEHNRTGYPNPPLPLLTSDSHRPYRLLYPSSEIIGNGSNVPNQSESDAFAPTIFWQN